MKNGNTRRLIAAFLLLSLLVTALSACTTPASEYTYDISFKVGKEYLPSVTVRGGELLDLPTPPSRENHIFTGWYTDEACTRKYDPTAPVNHSMTLFAGYELNEAGLINKITTDTLRGTVTVNTRCYTDYGWWDELLGKQDRESIGQGSGTIIKITESGRCYVLTNCHVAVSHPGYENVAHTVTDFRGKTYTAYMHRDNLFGKASIDPAYDLAILYFDTAEPSLYRQIELAEEDPGRSEEVISLGSPMSQANATTFGKVQQYTTITLKDTPEYVSNVEFAVIYHSAKINSGSSGGALLDSDLRLVGVNYAGHITEDKYEFTNGYAIPISRVREFLAAAKLEI